MIARWLEWIFIGFLVSHIPISLVMDFQLLLGKWYPPALQELSRWYLLQYNDPIMNPLTSPNWFRALVGCEILFQFPLFFYLAWNIYRRGVAGCWLATAVYGTHVVTTMVPVLAELYTSTLIKSRGERAILLAFYCPYFLIPALLLISALLCAGNHSFTTTIKRKTI